MSALSLYGFKKISCLAIVILTLWLSGFGCALCCSTGATDVCCAKEQTICNRPPEELSECCRKAEKRCVATTADSISQPIDASCSLLPNQTPSLLNLSSTTSLFAAVLPVYPFSLRLETGVQAPVYAGTALPNNRGSTYLRCCVFLI